MLSKPNDIIRLMGVNPEGLGVATPRFWDGGAVGRHGVSMKLYYIL